MREIGVGDPPPNTMSGRLLAVPNREVALSHDELGIHGPFDTTALNIKGRGSENDRRDVVDFRESVPDGSPIGTANFQHGSSHIDRIIGIGIEGIGFLPIILCLKTRDEFLDLGARIIGKIPGAEMNILDRISAKLQKLTRVDLARSADRLLQADLSRLPSDQRTI